ncbi:MAG: hypothetical protein WBD50_07505 [Candidatus Rhabdochlamydia sp.]
MTGLDENCLRNMKSSEILKQDFLRCDGNENISEKQNIIQKTFLKASIGANEPTYTNQPIYETIDEVVRIQTLYSEPYANEPIYEAIRTQKTDTPEKSLLTIEGSFKKRDAKNIQRIKDITQILTIYNPGQVNFDVQFNMILNAFKNLKSSSSKLAAFLYVLDSTKDKESPKIQINNNKIYKELPRKYKKLIKKSNPKFSLDMHSTESIKSIDSIRAHLKKRSIFIKADSLPLKDRI